MKKLVTNAEVFGPYSSIIEMEDRYRCDNFDLQFSIVGRGAIEDAQPQDFSALAPTVDPLEYQRLRAAEYPPMADYIDGIVKGDQAQVQAYIDACLAVKAKYPKPE